MPHIFDKLSELNLVDWETIAVYTCTNIECIPDPEHPYEEEFVYTQFSEDFAKIQLGDDQEIARVKKIR